MKQYTKLSALIRDAAADAKKVPQANFTPHYRYWHAPQDLGGCYICFAGAVLAGQIPEDWKLVTPCDLTHSYFGGKFTEQDVGQLMALDDVRKGDLRGALSHLDRYGFNATTSQLADLEELEDKIEYALDYYLPAAQFTNWDQFEDFLVGIGRVADELEKIGL